MISNKVKADVVIVGAGIAGLYLSKKLEEAGIKYFTLEKRSKIGTYGPRILSLETIEKLQIPTEKLIRPIKEINFYSPKNHKISKKGEEVRGYTTNLEDIEWHVFNSLKNKNNILFEHNVVDFDLNANVVKTSKGEFKFKALVLATGVLGVKFRDKLEISHPKSVFCYAVELNANDEITTILHNDLAKGFYGWIIPIGENRIEIGIGANNLQNPNQKEFHNRLFKLPYLRKYKFHKHERINAGYIPTSMIEKKSNHNWIVIGDAAGGEPMLGGSIHKCIDEASIASEVISDFLKYKISSLSEYEKKWDAHFGEEMKNQKTVRSLLDKAKNEHFDKVFKKLQNQPIDGKGLINDLFRNIVINVKEHVES